jgi:DNA processing protein
VTVLENRVPWVALNLVFHEKLASFQKIVRAFRPIAQAFQASPSEFKALGIDAEAAQELVSPRILERARSELERVEKLGFGVLTIEDDTYPAQLREIYDPPAVLYYAGDISVLNGPIVSMVGSRKPTPYGYMVAEKIAGDLAGCGLVVASGLAHGIDSAVHWGAVRKGIALAVLGSGLDRIYPRENRKLLEKIVEKGIVITEYPLTSRPLGHHFPLRNRIISGLSLAVVVVEATRKSGSLITARLALEQNREVLAVPGNITSELSRGTHWLIQSGARLIESWQDVVEELPAPWNEKLMQNIAPKREEPPALSSREKNILDRLPTDSLKHVDELVEETQLSVSEVLTALLYLEIKGCITPHTGQTYQRNL